MKWKLIGLVAICFLFLVVPLASASGPIQQGTTLILQYADGTSVTLPAGNYTTINLAGNVWYVDGLVYPAGSTPTPAPGDLTIEDVAGIAIIGIVLAIALPVAFLAMKRRED